MSWQARQPALVLASASTARQAVLAAAGVAAEIHPAAIDEHKIRRGARAEGAGPEETALLLAELKAARVARIFPDALVIGADQVLVCNGRWFDKPATLAEARTHLLALRGQPHTLMTAVACQRGGQRIWHHVAQPLLAMRDFSDAFLDAYLEAEGASLLACVGAYRLEGLGLQLFDSVAGEHAAILGLPLLPLLGFLRQHGVLVG